jgi:hypothetical protein
VGRTPLDPAICPFGAGISTARPVGAIVHRYNGRTRNCAPINGGSPRIARS